MADRVFSVPHASAVTARRILAGMSSLPDTRIDEAAIELPPLAGKPKKEKYGQVKPLPPFPVD